MKKKFTLLTLFSFVLSFLVLAALVVSITLSKFEENTRVDVGQRLDMLLNKTHGALDIRLQDLLMYSQQFVADPELLALVEEQLGVYTRNEDLKNSAALAQLRRLYTTKDALSGLGFFIIAPDFISVASKRDSNIGSRNLISHHRPDLMARLFAGETLIVPPILSDVPLRNEDDKLLEVGKASTMFVATPIRDASGSIIAALTIRVNPQSTFSPIARLGSTGDSGETYVFDVDGNLLSGREGSLPPAGYRVDTAYLREQLKSNLFRHHLAGNNFQQDDESEDARMALSATSLRTWLWDADLGVGLLTEIDADEAMLPYDKAKKMVMTLFFLMVLLSMGLVLVIWRVARNISLGLEEERNGLESVVQHRTEELLTSNGELLETRNYLNSLIESMPDAMISIDRSGNILRANAQAEQVFGYSEDELLGCSVDKLIPVADRDKHQQNIADYVCGTHLNKRGEMRFYAQAKHGWVFPVEINVNSVEIGGECIMIANIRDISERVEEEKERERLHAQLSRAQKMDSVGQLTAGIAHDFNNMLASVLGYTDLGLMSLQAGKYDKLESYFNSISTSGHRARELVQKLLAFSRGEEGTLEQLDPESLADEAVQMLRSTLPATIDLTTHFNGGDNSILGDATQLNQAIVNLLINARDAMDGRGKVDVGVETVTFDDVVCASCHANISGDFVALYVADNGPGIADEHLNQVFDPFYTTKEVGKGTGMGLAMIHGVVHSANGHIIVDTSASGTKISLLFPLTENKAIDLNRSQ
jgi:PAS domain S-box-containing protein